MTIKDNFENSLLADIHEAEADIQEGRVYTGDLRKLMEKID